MPAFAAVVLNDGLATPVAHTFGPSSLDANVAIYKDRISGVQAGFGELRIEVRQPQKGFDTTRVKLKISVPKVVTFNDATGKPVTRVDYTPLFDGAFVLPSGMTIAERKDLLAYAKNTLAHALVTSLIVDLEAIW